MHHIKQGQEACRNSLGQCSLGLAAADLNPSKVSHLQLDAKHDTRCRVSSPQDLQVVPEVSLSPPVASRKSNVIQNEDPEGQSADSHHTETTDDAANLLAATCTSKSVGGSDLLTNESGRTEETSSKVLKRKVRTARPGSKLYREKVRGLCGRNKIKDILKDINDKNGFLNDSGETKLFNNGNIRLLEKTGPRVHEKLKEQEIAITEIPEQATVAKTDPSDLVSVIDHSENKSENLSERNLPSEKEGLSRKGNYLHQNTSCEGKVAPVNDEQAIYSICDQRSIECNSDHQSKDGTMPHLHLQKMETSPHMVADTLTDFVPQAGQYTKNRETVDHKDRTSVKSEPARQQDVRFHKRSVKLASFEPSANTCSISDEQEMQYHDIVDSIKSSDEDIEFTKGQERQDRVFDEVSAMSENQEIQPVVADVLNAVVAQVCKVDSHVVTSKTKVEEAQTKRGPGRPPKEKQNKSLIYSAERTPEVEKVTDNLQIIETSQTRVVYEDVIDDISNVVATPVCVADELNAAENIRMPVAEDSSVVTTSETKIEKAHIRRGRRRPPKVKQKKTLCDTVDKTPKFEKVDNSLQNMEVSQTPEIPVGVTSDISTVVLTPGCVADKANTAEHIQMPVAEDSAVVANAPESEKSNVKRDYGRLPKEEEKKDLLGLVDRTSEVENVSNNNLQSMDMSQTAMNSVDSHSPVEHNQHFTGELSIGKEPSTDLSDQLDKDGNILTQVNTSEHVQSNFETESLPGIIGSVTKRRGRPKKKNKEQLLSTISVNTNLETDSNTCTPTEESTPINLGLKELCQSQTKHQSTSAEIHAASSVKNMNKQTSSGGHSSEQIDSIERQVTDTDIDSDVKSPQPVISGEGVNVENTDMLQSYQTTSPKSVTNLNQSPCINSTDIPNKTAVLSAADIILPFDNDPEETVSLSCSKYSQSERDVQTHAGTENAEMLSARQPSCKRRTRRRSAEAFLDTSLIIASPTNDDAEVAILPQPSSFRRSKRIRRKSLELYKSHLLPIPGTQSEDDENQCDETIQEQEGMQNSPSSENMKDSAFPADDSLQNTKDSVQCSQVPKVIITDDNSNKSKMEQSECSEDSSLNNVNNEQVVVSQEEKSITELLDTITEASVAGEETDEKSDNKSPSGKTPAKRGNRKQGKQKRGVKRKPEEPPLEDIYRNKLWRSQMPKPRGWETIFEEPPVGPHGDMGGDVFGNKKEKCLLSDETFYTQARMKHRKTRAARRGYKAPTKRRHRTLDKMLQSTIDKLDSDLAVV